MSAMPSSSFSAGMTTESITGAVIVLSTVRPSSSETSALSTVISPPCSREEDLPLRPCAVGFHRLDDPRRNTGHHRVGRHILRDHRPGGDYGAFAPYSWWPLWLGLAAALIFMGIAVGWWIVAIGVFMGVFALIGWTFESYKGQNAL